MHSPTRRSLILASAGLALLPTARLLAAPAFADNPFTLGVASGEPLPTGVVLWTRLCPLPFTPNSGLPDAAIEVQWQLANDAGFKKIVQQGLALAHPHDAHSLHIEVDGLAASRDYFYRFLCGGHASATGRTRTAPAPGAAVPQLRFAFASCQQFEQGYYAAYRQMADDAPDFVLHLGDYIYESSWGEAVRHHEGGEAITLDDYRRRHTCYRLDPQLQAAHAAAPWFCTWDDHEVNNDYAGDHAQYRGDPAQFRARRLAAYQAYWENLPLRQRARPGAGASTSETLLYTRARFGDLLDLFVLDTRQYRSDQACPTPERLGGRLLSDTDCPARLAPERTMTGPEQERWLLNGLSSSPSRWNLIAQQVLMAQVDQTPGPVAEYWSDAWDGYPAARARILQHLHSRKVANPVVLSGDIHSYWANDLKLDFADANSATVASEFVGTSITSRGVSYKRFNAALPDNPHIKYFESRHRGYGRCTVSAKQWHTEFMSVDNPQDANSPVRLLKAFVVEAGKPGVQSA